MPSMCARESQLTVDRLGSDAYASVGPPMCRVHPSMNSPGTSGGRGQWKDEGTDEEDHEDQSSDESSEEKGWFPVSIALFK